MNPPNTSGSLLVVCLFARFQEFIATAQSGLGSQMLDGFARRLMENLRRDPLACAGQHNGLIVRWRGAFKCSI